MSGLAARPVFSYFRQRLPAHPNAGPPSRRQEQPLPSAPGHFGRNRKTSFLALGLPRHNLRPAPAAWEQVPDVPPALPGFSQRLRLLAFTDSLYRFQRLAAVVSCIAAACPTCEARRRRAHNRGSDWPLPGEATRTWGKTAFVE
jgi:hypothetical protein